MLLLETLNQYSESGGRPLLTERQTVVLRELQRPWCDGERMSLKLRLVRFVRMLVGVGRSSSMQRVRAISV